MLGKTLRVFPCKMPMSVNDIFEFVSKKLATEEAINRWEPYEKGPVYVNRIWEGDGDENPDYPGTRPTSREETRRGGLPKAIPGTRTVQTRPPPLF